jgi:hypothetical protein
MIAGHQCVAGRRTCRQHSRSQSNNHLSWFFDEKVNVSILIPAFLLGLVFNAAPGAIFAETVRLFRLRDVSCACIKYREGAVCARGASRC